MDDIIGSKLFTDKRFTKRPWVSAPICMRSFAASYQLTISTVSSTGANHDHRHHWRWPPCSALAQHLVRGSEPVVLAAEDQSHTRQVATALGPLAMAVPVREAISQADTVVLAVWLDSLKEVVAEHSDLLNGKVIVDPTNPLGFDENGNFLRTLPEHQSSASVVAALLPPRAHDVKAFGTLSATSLASSDNRSPRRADLLADRALRVEEAGANIRLLSGTVEGIAAPAQTETPVQYLDLRLNAGARIDLPVPAPHNGFVLVEGEVKVGAERVHSGQGQARGSTIRSRRVATPESIPYESKPRRQLACWQSVENRLANGWLHTGRLS